MKLNHNLMWIRIISFGILGLMIIPGQLVSNMVRGEAPDCDKIWFMELDIAPPPVAQPLSNSLQGGFPNDAVYFIITIRLSSGPMKIHLMSHRRDQYNAQGNPIQALDRNGNPRFDELENPIYYNFNPLKTNNPIPSIPPTQAEISAYTDTHDQFRYVHVKKTSDNSLVDLYNDNDIHYLSGNGFLTIESTEECMAQDNYILYFSYFADNDGDTNGDGSTEQKTWQSVLRIIVDSGTNERMIDFQTTYTTNQNNCDCPRIGTTNDQAVNENYNVRILTGGSGQYDFYFTQYAKGLQQPARNEINNLYKRNQNDQEWNIKTRTDVYNKPFYQNSNFCYKIGNYPTFVMIRFDLTVHSTIQNNRYALSQWHFALATSGWDNPKTHDDDNDGLTDYEEADLGTKSSDLNSPVLGVYCPTWMTERYSWTKTKTSIMQDVEVIKTFALDTTFVVRRGSTLYVYGNGLNSLRTWDYFSINQNAWAGISISRVNTHWEITISNQAPVGIVRLSIGNWANGIWQAIETVDMLIVFQLPSPSNMISSDDIKCYGYCEQNDYSTDPDFPGQQQAWDSSRDRCENTAFYNWRGRPDGQNNVYRQYTYSLKPFELMGPGLVEYNHMEYRSAYLAAAGAHGATTPIEAAQKLARIVTQRMIWSDDDQFNGLWSDRRSYWYTGEYGYTWPLNGANYHVNPLDLDICHAIANNGNGLNNYQANLYGQGQCHDFASILTSFTRAVGIPSRDVSGVNTNWNNGQLSADPTTHMWGWYHVWTEIYLENPPQMGGTDNWFVADCCDQANHLIPNTNQPYDKHIEGAIDPRVDYYKTWKILNNHYPDGNGIYTNFLGDQIITAPNNWIPRYQPTTGAFPAATNDFSDTNPNANPRGAWKGKFLNEVNNIKSLYTCGENTHIQLQPVTIGHLLSNDYDFYKYTPTAPNQAISFSLININGNDPAMQSAAIWVSTNNYPKSNAVNDANFGTIGLGQNSNKMIYNQNNPVYYYLTITTGLPRNYYSYPGQNNPAQNNPTQEGNYYKYSITVS